ncbi:hypothetical protein BGX34_010033 [Mortierella sp. NVP85]|nr:hypothetical protein BGX34_010033 [Mortierella sp. NVP85]
MSKDRIWTKGQRPELRLALQLLVITAVLLLPGWEHLWTSIPLSAEASSRVEPRALHVSSLSDLEMIASWEPSNTERFNPHTGSLLAPLLIPRVSGTLNNTRVQQFILDYFAELNATSLAAEIVKDARDRSIESQSEVVVSTEPKTRIKSKHYDNEQLFRRAPGTPGTGWHVELDKFTDMTPYGEKTFTNLVFTKNPKAENRLVFAAHFDSKYFPPTDTLQAQWNGGEDTLPFIAATDSAVPCAILLDLAASLDRALDQPGRNDKDTTLQLIFFDGEEAFKDWSATDSLYGSRTATGRSGGSTTNNLDGIELFVLLDLLGSEGPNVPSYFGATQWAHRHTMSIEQRLWEAKLHGGQALARKKEGLRKRAGEEEDDMDIMDEDLPLQGFLTANAPWAGIDDDHRPFLQKGVPIFHVIPVPFPDVWHTLEDNADAISPEVVEGWANIFRTFAVEYLQLLKPRERRRDEL